MAEKSKPVKRTTATLPGKRRTREHVIAALSVNFVERLVLKCGYVVQRSDPDYGYDLWIDTFDEYGNLEAGRMPLQLKATDRIEEYTLAKEEAFSFPISATDYRLWSVEVMPVFLILYDAGLEEGYWLHIQDYARTQHTRVEGETLRVHIPKQQVLGVQTIRLMRERKQEILRTFNKGLKRKTKSKEV